MNLFIAAAPSYTIAVLFIALLAAASTLLAIAGVLSVFRRILHPTKSPVQCSAEGLPDSKPSPPEPKVHRPVPDSDAQTVWQLSSRLQKNRRY